MLETDNLKIVKWFEYCKKIVNENTDIPVVFTNKEFCDYVNRRVPIQIKISQSYINQILSYNPETSTLPATTEAKFGDEFRAWFDDQRKEQELKLYKKMLMNGESSWQRFDNVLAKRFGKKWQKQDHLKVDQDTKVSGNVNITFKKV